MCSSDLADVDRATRYLEHEFDGSGRSLALFSCAADDYFKSFSLALPLRSRARVFNRPYVKPLAAVMEDFGHTGAVLVDQREARLFHFHLGELIAQKEVRGEAVRRIKHGGGSQEAGRKGISGGQARAVEAWVAATQCDLTYLDVYRRLATLYRRQGQLDSLAALTAARIDAGADTPTLVGLLLEQARQRRERGDVQGVTDALDECLELDPHHFAALQELVDTHRAAENWQGAAEALIRIVRLNRSTDEQIWAFSQLAETYDLHLQDLPRAEASLRQVAKLAPTHIQTLDRLASVLSRQGKAPEAARLLEELVLRADGDAADRDYRIRLARAVESAGQARKAELMLENLRSGQPTEPDVILAVADYYQRQGASPAEAMHLNRAASDLRTAIDSNPGDEGLWTTLVRVLKQIGRASCRERV